LNEISSHLDVEVDEEYFKPLSLNWDQVLEMNNNGIEFGAHTISHPILSSVPVEKARYEISESKKRIEEVLKKDVLSIAYPNGQTGDFSDAVIELVRKNGYQIAYSLISGPSSYKEISRERYAIRRIFLSHLDKMPRFIAKVHGLARFV
jgi:peptidoglycan/xylan/chitin deacetylase (PgdA/CDA1 family)